MTKERERLFLLAELLREEHLDRVERLGCFLAARGETHGAPHRRRQHQNAHDRGAAHGLAAARHLHLGLEPLHCLHQPRRGSRVQAALVDDRQLPRERAPRQLRGGRAVVVGRGWNIAHLPASTRLAILMYLRPASCAWATASARPSSSRTFASFTSIGRVGAGPTSTLGASMHEIARLEGVPPNMSVRMATPLPESALCTASRMSSRRRSMLSSGPMVTVSICRCGPTTCSRAARNSTARRPWVTMTMPIMEALPAQGLTAGGGGAFFFG